MEARKQSLSLFDKMLGALLQIADSFWSTLTETSARTHGLLPVLTGAPYSLRCPACDTSIILTEEVRVGRIVTCASCRIPWEVAGQLPVKLTSVEPHFLSELIEGDWAD
jgi:hypothetical protein